MNGAQYRQSIKTVEGKYISAHGYQRTLYMGKNQYFEKIQKILWIHRWLCIVLV
jgi:hypothetical protein